MQQRPVRKLKHDLSIASHTPYNSAIIPQHSTANFGLIPWSHVRHDYDRPRDCETRASLIRTHDEERRRRRRNCVNFKCVRKPIESWYWASFFFTALWASGFGPSLWAFAASHLMIRAGLPYVHMYRRPHNRGKIGWPHHSGKHETTRKK